MEFSGTVAGTGRGVRSREVGDEVFGIVGGGAHATHLLTLESLCARRPKALDPVEAGGVPEVFVTAHDALVGQADLRSGETLLIHGVGSGVGTAAVQLASVLGAITIGTARTASKLERAKELGLDRGVLASDRMADEIGEVDVVMDLLGGSYVELDLQVCRTKGRIVLVGLIAGAQASVDLGTLLRQRLTLRGTVLRTRPEYEKAAATAAFEAEVVPLFERGALRAVIDSVVPLSDAASAYERMASNENFGKIVLDMRG
jgi:NADPH:quinone reductase-like Zn-dependent oxidoreductase